MGIVGIWWSPETKPSTYAGLTVGVHHSHTRVSHGTGTQALQAQLITGKKVAVHTHRNYMVIVSPPIAPSVTAASATVRNLAAKSKSADNAEITKLTVFDLENHFVAYTGTFTTGIREVFSAHGQIYALANDGSVDVYFSYVVTLWAHQSPALVSRGETHVGKAGHALSQISFLDCSKRCKDSGPRPGRSCRCAAPLWRPSIRQSRL